MSPLNRICSATMVPATSLATYHPQTQGKIGRWHQNEQVPSQGSGSYVQRLQYYIDGANKPIKLWALNRLPATIAWWDRKLQYPIHRSTINSKRSGSFSSAHAFDQNRMMNTTIQIHPQNGQPNSGGVLLRLQRHNITNSLVDYCSGVFKGHSES